MMCYQCWEEIVNLIECQVCEINFCSQKCYDKHLDEMKDDKDSPLRRKHV